MRVRIIKKTFKGNTMYAVQGKVPLLPIWYVLREDDGMFDAPYIYSDSTSACAAFDRIVAERDYRPESCVSTIIDEA